MNYHLETKISVLVALYNAENYLNRFFYSLLRQTMSDFDIIIVDDGSTDNSFNICQEYSRSDNRIRLYKNNHGGVSSARNYCLKKLITEGGGKYAIFLDPDDYFELNMLECLYYSISESNADVLICDYYVDWRGEKTKYKGAINQDPTPEDIINNLLLGNLHAGLWNKLVRSSCFMDYNLRFPDGLNYQEDFCLLINLLQRVNKVAYLPSAFYYYCYNEISLSNNHSSGFIVESRMLLLKHLRENSSSIIKNWRFSVYEIGIAYYILLNNVMTDSAFRLLFNNIRPSVLFHPHTNYRRSVMVFLVICGLCSQYSVRRISHLFGRH